MGQGNRSTEGLSVKWYEGKINVYLCTFYIFIYFTGSTLGIVLCRRNEKDNYCISYFIIGESAGIFAAGSAVEQLYVQYPYI